MKHKFLQQTASVAFVAACILLPCHHAQAQEVGTLAYYDVPVSEYYDASTGQYKPAYYQWKEFLGYNLKQKPCGGYQQPPAGYVMRGCHVYRNDKLIVEAIPQTPPPVMPAAPPPPPEPQKDYSPVTIYFDFDKSNIRNGENDKLDEIVNKVAADNPSHVVIAGHTDTAGPVNYNNWLAQRRAAVVAEALKAKGVNASIIEQKSYGKTDLAVPEADNTPMQANRRTVVLFVQ